MDNTFKVINKNTENMIQTTYCKIFAFKNTIL